MSRRALPITKQLNLKTKMCKFGRECTDGNGCRFAHSRDELQEVPDLKYTVMCRKHLLGKCHTGADCSFAHDESQLRTVQRSAVPQSRSRGPSVSSSPAALSDPKDLYRPSSTDRRAATTSATAMPSVDFPESAPGSVRSVLHWRPKQGEEIVHACGYFLRCDKTFLVASSSLTNDNDDDKNELMVGATSKRRSSSSPP
eukprot:TRINITY_DN21110_c0_g1_i1.p1 TRINITY_DN21110_c0_g1~~TRINITY_DN21110_c0_g1_i1.p1  ORF type:complete len:199 (+),score=15.94 TRINITY_DN21110_c0_g1_i1:111-707(+)